jgi:hypothetical protein
VATRAHRLTGYISALSHSLVGSLNFTLGASSILAVQTAARIESEAPRREWWMVSLYGDGGELSPSPLIAKSR